MSAQGRMELSAEALGREVVALAQQMHSDGRDIPAFALAVRCPRTGLVKVTATNILSPLDALRVLCSAVDGMTEHLQKQQGAK